MDAPLRTLRLHAVSPCRPVAFSYLQISTNKTGISGVAGRYSSASNLPKVGLCLSGFVFFAGTRREGFGLPTRSRAISRTTLAAEKIFFLRLRGMVGMPASSHIRSAKVQ